MSLNTGESGGAQMERAGRAPHTHTQPTSSCLEQPIILLSQSVTRINIDFVTVPGRKTPASLPTAGRSNNGDGNDYGPDGGYYGSGGSPRPAPDEKRKDEECGTQPGARLPPAATSASRRGQGGGDGGGYLCRAGG